MTEHAVLNPGDWRMAPLSMSRLDGVRQCESGHLSLAVANWVCPWCEVARLRKAAADLVAEYESCRGWCGRTICWPIA